PAARGPVQHFRSERFASIDYDGSGNLVLASAGRVVELAADGTPRWSRALSALVARTGPGNTVYVQTTTELVKLAPDGSTLCSVPLGAFARSTVFEFDRDVDVALDGTVAIPTGSQIGTWNTDGVPGWTATLDPELADNDAGLAFDSTGVLWVAGEIFGDSTQI